MTATSHTWYYDDHRTHGEEGLVCVDLESHANAAGVGPDETFTGTAWELAAHLLDHGYTEVEVPGDRAATKEAQAFALLRAAWRALHFVTSPAGRG